MSRSTKKPIFKVTPRNHNKAAIYWRTVRRVINAKIRYYQEESDDVLIPRPEEVVNDYDYCDYIWDGRFVSVNDTDDQKDWAKRIGRK